MKIVEVLNTAKDNGRVVSILCEGRNYGFRGLVEQISIDHGTVCINHDKQGLSGLVMKKPEPTGELTFIVLAKIVAVAILNPGN